MDTPKHILKTNEGRLMSAGGKLTLNGNSRVPSPIEIHFYDDYLVIYSEKRYYDKRVSRKEYNKFHYHDINDMDYDCRTNRFTIRGKIDAMWFDYNKDGSVPQTPTYHRVVDGGICYFYIIDNNEKDIISQIEKFSSKKVILINEGRELPLYCKNCGNINPEGNSFCSHCGADLTEDAVKEKILREDSEMVALNNKYATRNIVRIISGIITGLSALGIYNWLGNNVGEFIGNISLLSFLPSLIVFIVFSILRSSQKKKIMEKIEEKYAATKQ